MNKKKILLLLIILLALFTTNVKADSLKIENIECYNTYKGEQEKIEATSSNGNIALKDARFYDENDNVLCKFNIKNESKKTITIIEEKINKSTEYVKYELSALEENIIEPGKSKNYEMEISYLKKSDKSFILDDNLEIIYESNEDKITNPKTGVFDSLPLGIIIIISGTLIFIFIKKREYFKSFNIIILIFLCMPLIIHAKKQEILIINTKIEVGIQKGCYFKNTVDDPNPGEFRGNGTINDPYLLESIEDIAALSSETNKGSLNSDLYYKLTKDLDYKCENSYIDFTRKDFKDINKDGRTDSLLIEFTTSTGWTPIGTESHSFQSNFDGDNHIINNLYMNGRTENNIGFFGTINTNTKKGLVIKNLKLTNVDIQTDTKMVGSLIGAYRSNIKSDAEYDMIVSNIETTGNIECGRTNYCGGVIGLYNNLYNKNKIEKVINYINVTGENEVGGIIAELYQGDGEDLKNFGTISGGQKIGGIAGYSLQYNKATLNNVYNYGNIIAGSGFCYTGGIVGYSYGGDGIIKNAYNYGNVKAYNSDGGQTAGISGRFNYTTGYNLYNYGNIDVEGKGQLEVGGIVGYNASGGRVYNAANLGEYIKVKGIQNNNSGYTAGIIGFNSQYDYHNLYNEAKIYVDNIHNVAGIVGSASNYNGYNLINMGDIEINEVSSVNAGTLGTQNADMYNAYSISNIKFNNFRVGDTNSYIGAIYSSDYNNRATTENIYYKGSITGVDLLSLYVFNGNLKAKNIYSDLTTDANYITTNFYRIDTDYRGHYLESSDLYYHLNKPEGSAFINNDSASEYDFSKINTNWFKNTLKLGNNFKYEEGYYPQLYKSDIDGNPTNELLIDKKIPIK